jgi:hypothetical protein
MHNQTLLLRSHARTLALYSTHHLGLLVLRCTEMGLGPRGPAVRRHASHQRRCALHLQSTPRARPAFPSSRTRGMRQAVVQATAWGRHACGCWPRACIVTCLESTPAAPQPVSNMHHSVFGGRWKEGGFFLDDTGQCPRDSLGWKMNRGSWPTSRNTDLQLHSKLRDLGCDSKSRGPHTCNGSSHLKLL